MTLYDFCDVCKIPFLGSVTEPRPRDEEDFIATTTVGEERGVSEARVASLHFPVLHYYLLFAQRCLIGRGESGGLSAPDLAILCHALYSDRTFSLGAIVARQLNTNCTKVLFSKVSMPPALLNILRCPLGMMRKKRCCYPLNI